MMYRGMTHALAITALSSILVIGATGCKKDGNGGSGGNGASGDTILVGEYGSMTGAEAAFGESTHDGIMLAVDEINKAGGVTGKQIKIIGPEDTESNTQKAEIAVKRLIEKDVVAVLGEVASSRSRAGAAICQNEEVPMVSPSSTNPTVTEVGDFIFRVCFIDPFQGGVIAKFAKDSLNANTAAVFFDQGQTYSVGIKDEFSKAFIAKGGKIVGEAAYGAGDKDFKAQLTKLKSFNPDVIIVAGYYSEGGAISKQARDLGITKPLIGGDGWSDAKFHEYAGSNISNVFFSDHASVESPAPAIQKYVAAFKTKYNGKEPNSLGALGYDAMMVLADAMKRAKSLSGPDIRDALATTSGFQGATGTVTLNSQRNADKGAVIIEVSGGKFKFKEAIDKL